MFALFPSSPSPPVRCTSAAKQQAPVAAALRALAHVITHFLVVFSQKQLWSYNFSWDRN